MSEPMGKMEAAGGLAVTTGVDVNAGVDRLRTEGIPAKVAAKDATLWGPEAEEEASIRLGWVDTFVQSKELVAPLAKLRAELAEQGIDHVALCGMGGSSLAPEVISRTLGLGISVLDSTDPGQILAELGEASLRRTVVVVSSKSGSTVETDSQRRGFEAAFKGVGIEDYAKRFVFVTDPDSELEKLANAQGSHLFLADATVGGRYSALTAFGLVPTALAGADIAELIDQAEEFATSITSEGDNPAVVLGAVIAARPTITIADDGTGIVGLGDWAEQLIAESLGKDGKGTLPVVLEGPAAPGARGADRVYATVGGSSTGLPASGSALAMPDVVVNGPLGAQFLAWELATAYAGYLIGIDPFNQPNVTESKENTKRLLAEGLPDERPHAVDGAVEIYGSHADTVAGALGEILTDADSEGAYIAVMAYLDRIDDAEVAQLRAGLAERTGAPVTWGWGPRFLHSTGQFHKGGRQTGVFLQITGEVGEDLLIPDREFTFAGLQAAQAAGDRQALQSRGRPLVRLHLTDRKRGINQLVHALRELS
ncbi:glucose-6-phosphate isomerase [Glycomyces terrestris]|uniref:Glucose-6-phosphate isomerase n=1 Tax=Glycomyces terrestris TaxID=2493553 RepID=A0A426V1J4_9ACTN|nr:glucose-6-phosphate isomerase [Glycomyces terrestris]RRS00716.1 glucose-6-phosphate isomerase [Glycomyces terrestris]